MGKSRDFSSEFQGSSVFHLYFSFIRSPMKPVSSSIIIMTTNIKYLDPKADLTFKKIFAGHPDLLISLFNALLPLKRNQQIKSIEYLPTELVPVDLLHKDTIVDVRCRDVEGRQFVVEMQMAWTDAFKQRVLFNASKAYVSQAEMGCKYEDLQPVYSLKIVSAFTAEELRAYDKFWDRVSSEKTLMEGRYDEGKQDKALEIAQNLKSAGMDVDTICKMTGLSKEEIEE